MTEAPSLSMERRPRQRRISRDALDSVVLATTEPVICIWAAAGAGKSVLLETWADALQAAGIRVEHRAATGLLPETLPAECVVVIDDAHLLPGPVVERLIDSLRTASGLRLILAGRHNPAGSMAAYEASGLVRHLRTADLALSPAETSSLAAESSVVLTTRQATDLTGRVGGWMTGVVLALPLLRSTPNLDATISRLVQDRRSVADYLTSEVLSQVADMDVLVTCAVSEWLPFELAPLLSGVADAANTLERLSRTLALIELTDYGVRFHPVLLVHLQAEAARLGQLHRMHAVASRWYRNLGEAHRTLEHAVLSADATVLDEAFGAFGLELLMTGLCPPLVRAIAHEGASDSPAVRTLRLLANFPYADRMRARHLMRRARESCPAGSGSVWDTAIAAVEHFIAPTVSAGDAPLQSRHHLANRADSFALELLCTLAEGWAMMHSGDGKAGLRTLRGVADSARNAGWLLLHIEVSAMAASAASSLGQWELAEVVEIDMVESVADIGGPPVGHLDAVVHIITAARRYQQALPAPETRLDDIWRADRTTPLGLGIPARLIRLLPELDHAERSRDAAMESTRLLQLAGERFPRLVAASFSRIVQTHLSQGRKDEALAHLAFGRSVLGDDCVEVATAEYLVDPPRARGDAREAALQDALGHRRAWHSGGVIGAWLLLAAFARETHRPMDSRLFLRRALDQASRLGTVRPFLAFGGQGAVLLRESRGHLGVRTEFDDIVARRTEAVLGFVDDHPVEHLTAKERLILAEMPTYQSVADIAATHHVSANTVKTHLRNIYAKLDVSDRNAAVQKAYRLGLL